MQFEKSLSFRRVAPNHESIDMPSRMILVLVTFGLLMASPVQACRGSTPPSSAQILKFQIGLIDRGLAREKLSDADRAKIIVLRSKVEDAQKSGKPELARETVGLIVNMFSYKEFGGTVEPLLLKCGLKHPS